VIAVFSDSTVCHPCAWFGNDIY